MTRLLVSVRAAAEARAALDAGVHLIDVKEPQRGSLGAADGRQVADVLSTVAGRVPVSAAMGELFRDRDWLSWVGDRSLVSLSYVKWGLAGAKDHADWVGAWASAVGHCPCGTSAVAVQYADWQTARSPPPRELLAACQAHAVRTLLVDTFEKSAGGLLDAWPIERLRPFVAAARDAQMTIVLAGSLTLATVPRVLSLRPDYIAVRGAVCRGRREGTIDPCRVRALLDVLA